MFIISMGHGAKGMVLKEPTRFISINFLLALCAMLYACDERHA